MMTRPRSQVLIYLDLLEATMGAILIVNTIDKKMLQFVVVVVLEILLIENLRSPREGWVVFVFWVLSFEYREKDFWVRVSRGM